MMINKIIASIIPYVPKKLVWIFSKRYIAGEKIEDAINVSKALNSDGICVTVDLLGEHISEMEAARVYKEKYLEIIETSEQNGIKGNYSLKPTMFGLLIDKEGCYQNIREIVIKAAKYNNFVRVDMEDSICTDLEIDIFERLKKEFPHNVGLVFQAYLKRTLNDISNLQYLKNGESDLNYRICKGIYIESPEIAYRKPKIINDNFISILEYLFKNDVYAAIATHDKDIVNRSIELIEKYKVSNERFEFQMLYGVTPELRKQLLKKGYKIRVYVPFGKDWFNYSVRRLKENPKMVQHIIKSLFIKN